MKIRTLGWLVGLSAIASSFLSCTQAKVVCVVGHAGAGTGIAYTSTYTVKNAPACASMTMDPFAGLPLDKVPGDLIGFETYHPAKDSGEGDGEKVPDFTVSDVALQANTLGEVVRSRDAEMNPDDHPFSIGKFSTPEPENDFCSVQDLKPAHMKFPKVDAVPPDPMNPDDMGTPEQPPLEVGYAWKNLKLYVTAAAQGTQFSGDLTYTQDGCSVDYHVIGVWPSVSCEAVDADGKGTGKPDDSLCCPNAVNGHATGSGIDPDFAVKCDPDRLLCVLDLEAGKDIPALGGPKIAACKSSTTAAQ